MAMPERLTNIGDKLIQWSGEQVLVENAMRGFGRMMIGEVVGVGSIELAGLVGIFGGLPESRAYFYNNPEVLRLSFGAMLVATYGASTLLLGHGFACMGIMITGRDKFLVKDATIPRSSTILPAAGRLLKATGDYLSSYATGK